MIEKKDIQALPFVDGTPDPIARPDQARIDWIKNGECPSGADTSIGNGGSLNRSGVSVQKNVVDVQKNIVTVKSSLDETIDMVNKHDEIIGQAGALDLIETVKKHDDEIETLNFAVVQNAERFEELANKVQKNTDELGEVPAHDHADRSVRDELEWQKTEMGSYPGFDYNGKPDVDSRGTGMKNRIINNSMAISGHNARLNELETNWQTSDIGSLTREVQAIRSEVGPKDQKVPGHHIYDRLKKVENTADAGKTDIQKLNVHTGIATFPRPEAMTLVDLVDLKTSELNELVKSLAKTDARVLVVETEIGDELTAGTIKYNVKTSMQDIKDLYGIVGKSNSEGLRYSVAVLETEIGADNVPGTVKNRILLTEQGIRDLNIQIDAINDMLGVNSGGSGSFSDRVNELELQMNGDANGATDFEKVGAYPYAFELFNKKPVGDVLDGKTYVRTQDAWVILGHSDIDLVNASFKVDGKDFIIKKNEVIELGSDGSIVTVVSALDGVTFVAGARVQRTFGTDVVDSQVFEFNRVADEEFLTLGDGASVTDIVGRRVLINGSDILSQAVADVTDNQFYLRTQDAWVGTDQTIPMGHVTAIDGKNIFLADDLSVVIGADDKDTVIRGVKEIKTKNLEIKDEADGVILANKADRITLADKPLYVGLNRVQTTADDAPNDNDYYARYKGTWAKINPNGGGTGGGIEDAPNDDKSYVRLGQAWTELGSVPVNIHDDIGVQWEVSANNFTGLKFSKLNNKLSVGGSGAKVDILGDVSRFSLASGTAILQTLNGSTASAVASDTDKNLLIGDKDAHKSVVLRSIDDAQIQTSKGQFKIWHSGDDAKADGQIYGRKDNKWVVFTVNRTQDVILNNTYSFKVADSKDKVMTLATSGLDNLIELGEIGTLMNIRSTLRSINLDDKVQLTSTDGADKINLIGKDADLITISDVSKKVRINGSELRFNDKRVITEADDAPADGFKYVRNNKKWEKAYSYGEDAPSSVGAKEGDVYFQYM